MLSEEHPEIKYLLRVREEGRRTGERVGDLDLQCTPEEEGGSI